MKPKKQRASGQHVAKAREFQMDLLLPVIFEEVFMKYGRLPPICLLT